MMTNKFMRKREKIRAQMKSRFYYWFWGATAVAVVGGQLYVGTSYRIMAKSMNRWFEETVDLLQDPIKPRFYLCSYFVTFSHHDHPMGQLNPYY